MSEKIEFDCWSANGENYHSDIDSVIDELEVGQTIYEGVKKAPNVKDWVSADSIIEDIQTSCWDDHGEWAEDFLGDVSPEAKEELEVLVAAWVMKHDAPNFWLATQVVERDVTEEDLA